MRNTDVLKTMWIVAKGILKVAGTITMAGIALVKAYEEHNCVGYNNAVEAIMNSTMFSSDKAKAVSALKLNASPELYLAIINIVKSSILSIEKLNLILEMCGREEA